MSEKRLNSRIIHKHDTEANWLKATNFIPMFGEIIIYDTDENYNYPRIKIGNGVNLVNDLPFACDPAGTTQSLLEGIVFNIDYDTHLAFDTSAIVIGSTSPVLGQAILGQLVLA